MKKVICEGTSLLYVCDILSSYTDRVAKINEGPNCPSEGKESVKDK